VVASRIKTEAALIEAVVVITIQEAVVSNISRTTKHSSNMP
jgi:hypothetical protein